MNIEISDDLYQKVVAYTDKLNKAYGKKKKTTPEGYIDSVMLKFLKKKEHLEANDAIKINKSLHWKDYKVKHFTEIVLRDQRKCVYCLRRLKLNQITIDHRVAPIRGGLNTLENLAVACMWCNNDKGILTPQEYRYKQQRNQAKGITPEMI